MHWAERAADRSPAVQRSRSRGVQQATAIVEAAQRLIATKGASFTTQELVREAGIALQTFYRYFSSKDQLLLAVIENLVGESCIQYRQRASRIPDPIARLHFYVTIVILGLDDPPANQQSPRFITTEHWRLSSLYPEEVEWATKPFTDLLLAEIREAVDAGILDRADPASDAWLLTQLVMAVYHHHAFAKASQPTDAVAERLWTFCLGALQGGCATRR